MRRLTIATCALALLSCGDDVVPATPADLAASDVATAVDAAAPIDVAMADAPPIPDGNTVDTAAPDLSTAPVRFAVIGDYGANSSDEMHVAMLVESWHPDFVVTVGDNNYPSGLAATIDDNIGKYYARWIGDYHGAFGPGGATNRFWPTPGNHDWYTGISPIALQPYLDYFTALPGNRRYYDVDFGLVHMFAVDSHDPVEGPNTGDPDGWTSTSVQGAWLEATMAKSTSCYNLVFFHHPPYSSGKYHVPSMRWPFEQWGADAVLSGHEHFYERLSVDGIPYFNDGLGGSDRFPTDGMRDPNSQVLYGDDFGAILVTATRTSITFEFWTVGGEKIDAFTVAKTCK